MAHRATEALNEDAAAWFARLQGADLSPEDQRAFDDWIDADPARAVAFARVESAWERTERLTASPPQRAPVSGRFAALSTPMSRRAAAAALLAVGAGGAGLWWMQREATYETRVGERRTVFLPDGSRVDLNTASRIGVGFTSDLRQVRLLDGEALFEVAKDAARPFVVRAGDAAVTAVGTAFNVRLRGAAAEVAVTEGVVAIADRSAPAATAVRVAAGRLAVVARGAVKEASLDRDALERRTAWRNGIIELRGETLEQAVAEFNRYRTTKLIIADPRLAAIRVGGAFETDESEKFLAALRSGFGVSTRQGAGGSVYLVSAT